MFNNIYKDKTVLITGIKGFKGSWLAFWLNKLGAKVVGYSDYPMYERFVEPPKKSTYLYHNLGIRKIDLNPKPCDILNVETLNKVFNKFNPDIVFHLAAQPIVKTSYEDPINTYNTNVIGTLNVLEAARNCKSVKAFINVTTDKVYENIESLGYKYKETDQLSKSGDPYSNSKALCESLTESYRKSFLTYSDSFKLVSVRSGNVIGGGDWHYRLIPQTICSIREKNIIKLVKDESYRPWMFVFDTLAGYLRVGQVLLDNKHEYSHSFNFAPNINDALSVNDVIDILCNEWIDETLPKPEIIHIENLDGFKQSNILQLDNTLAKAELDVYPVWDTERAIIETVKWYKTFFTNPKKLIKLAENQLNGFITKAESMKLAWTV